MVKRFFNRTRQMMQKLWLTTAALVVLVGCGGDSVDVTAPDGFRPTVPRDVVRALQETGYGLVIQVKVDDLEYKIWSGESNSVEPIILGDLSPGTHQFQLVYMAKGIDGCTDKPLKLAHTRSKSITVEENKETLVSFLDSEIERKFAGDDIDEDSFSNLEEIKAGSKPCVTDSQPLGLENLQLLSAKLTIGFRPGVKSYTAHVSDIFPVNQIYVIANPNTEGATTTVKINDQTVVPNVAPQKVSPPIFLPEFGLDKPNKLVIEVSNGGTPAIYTVYVTRPPTVLTQEAYLKASNTGGTLTNPLGDGFGSSITIKGDGQVLVVGAGFEDSGSTDVNGNQNNNTAANSGAAYAFVRGTAWSQQAYLKAKIPPTIAAPPNLAGVHFGATGIAMSGNGRLIAIGAELDDSSTLGVVNGGGMVNTDAKNSGAVYLLGNTPESGWHHLTYIKASNTDSDDRFGNAIAMDNEGTVMVIGAVNQASSDAGINKRGDNDGAIYSGAAYAFRRVSQRWEQTAYIKASNTHEKALFAGCLALSPDGNTLAVGSRGERSASAGIDVDQTPGDANSPNVGAVYVFDWNGTAWTQQAYIKASNASTRDQFGCGLALGHDNGALYLAVGAPFEGSGATGVEGDPLNDNKPESGAVYIFHRDANRAWSQQAYIKAFNTESYDRFGTIVRLSDNGSRLLVTAPGDDGDGKGIGAIRVNPVHDNNEPSDVGGAYLFLREGNNKWSQEAYIKPSNGEAMDQFGSSAAMNLDGSVLAIGSALEDSSAKGVNPVDGETDNNAVNSGAVYVFRVLGVDSVAQTYLPAPE